MQEDYGPGHIKYMKQEKKKKNIRRLCSVVCIYTWRYRHIYYTYIARCSHIMLERNATNLSNLLFKNMNNKNYNGLSLFGCKKISNRIVIDLKAEGK